MAEQEFWSWVVWTPILVTLISGSVSALGNKVAYDTPVDGSCGKNTFQKAYFFTLSMFLGEFLCLGIYHTKQFLARRRQTQPDSYHALGNGSPTHHDQTIAVNLVPASSFRGNPEHVSSLDVSNGGLQTQTAAAVTKPPIWVYAVLSCFDLSATAVGGVGLIWVDASTNQMLRGSMVVFCAIFSVLMLKRKLTGSQWGAIGIVCIGLAMVGLSGMLKKHFDPSSADASSSVSSGQLLIGIFLVLCGSALNAIQNVYEEKLLKAVGGADVDPLELVGWEGFFGTCYSSFILLPIVYYIPGHDCGRAEDSINTLEQLGNSPLVVCCVLAFIIGLCLMNWTSQQISQQLSAVHRNLVSAVRTVLVWLGSLILFYTTQSDATVYGEQWTNWSLLELSGFLVLVAGTVLYSYYGLQQAAKEAAIRQIEKDISSPEYVVPIDPTLAEHSQIAKQEAKHTYANGNHRSNNAGRGYHSSHTDSPLTAESVYDEDDN